MATYTVRLGVSGLGGNAVATRVRESDGYYLHSVNGYEAYDSAHVAGYNVGTWAEHGTSGDYSLADPDPDGSAGSLALIVKAGSNLAQSDLKNVYAEVGIDGPAGIPDDGIDAGTITAAAANKLADHFMRRHGANVKASANGDALLINSLYGMLQMAQYGGPATSTHFPVHHPDGTLFATMSITVSSGAKPIIAVEPP